jgi:hypothetical protein
MVRTRRPNKIGLEHIPLRARETTTFCRPNFVTGRGFALEFEQNDGRNFNVEFASARPLGDRCSRNDFFMQAK